jgi:hypothetical protein
MLDQEKVTSFHLTAVERNSRIYSDLWIIHLEILVIGNFRFRFRYEFRFRFGSSFRFRPKFRFKMQPKTEIRRHCFQTI